MRHKVTGGIFFVMRGYMSEWLKNTLESERKTPTAVLSFPSAQLLGVSVRELISSSELQAKGMIEIAKRVKMGAAVGLMDLSVEAECFGAEISAPEDEVPTVVGSIVSDMEGAEALVVPRAGEKRDGIYCEAAAKAKKIITDRPVFGGCIGPFSLAGRLMDVTDIMIYCYEQPEMVHTVLEKCAAFLKDYIGMYKKAGVDGVIMAEPLAGVLSPALAEEFSSAYVKDIISALQSDDFYIIYHNCGASAVKILEGVLSTGAKVLHFGDAVDLTEVLRRVPRDVIVMGNVSPSEYFRSGTPLSMREKTLSLMESCAGYGNFVPSSGCDIPPLCPWENINAFFSAVDEFYSGVL